MIARHRRLAFWATTLQATSLAQASSTTPPRQVPAKQVPALDERLATAQADAILARGLNSRGHVTVTKVSRSEMATLVNGPAADDDERADSLEISDEDARNFLLSLRTLMPREGRPPAEPDATETLAAQASGLYVPSKKTLFVVDEGSGAADGSVLLHEFVHALQDEHFDLGPKLREDARGLDALNARHAFVEGDATLAVLLDANLMDPIDESFLKSFTKGLVTANRKNAGEGVSHAVADSVVSPYVYGTLFVWSLYTHGGWPAVNTAWSRPPATTEQLLHPAKYRTREAPIALRGKPLGPEGFTLRSRQTMGELDVRTWLAAFVADDDADRLASAWGNGVTELYERPANGASGQAAFALRVRVRWDHGHTARATETRDRLVYAFTERFGAPITRGGTACFERPNVGPIAFAATQHELLALAGPSPLSMQSATSASATCDDLFTWAKRVKAAP